MTTIKCKKCECNIEIPSDSRKCAECGTAIYSSVNTVIKDSEKEIKVQLAEGKKRAVKKIYLLQRIAKTEIAKNTKRVNRQMLEIRAAAKSQLKALPKDAETDVMEAIVWKSNKDCNAVFEEGAKVAEEIISKHNKEVAIIADQAGIKPPKSSLSIQKLSNADIVADSASKLGDAVDLFQYGIFFLVTPLGMILVEQYPVAGGLLLVAGMLALPQLSKAILKKLNWIGRANLFLLTHVILLAGLIKAITDIG